jgi:hypothetical protein
MTTLIDKTETWKAKPKLPFQSKRRRKKVEAGLRKGRIPLISSFVPAMRLEEADQ